MHRFAFLALALTVAQSEMLIAAPVLPGYMTDPSVNWREISVKATVTPKSLRYPYVALNLEKDTYLAGEDCKVNWFVTDFDHSLNRFGDKTFRFDMQLRLTTDRIRFKTYKKAKVPSGDGTFDLGKLPVGSYYVGLSCVDCKTRLPSHTIWQEFRVVEKEALEPSSAQVLKVTDAMLEKCGIRADPGYERICPVELGVDVKTARDEMKQQKKTESSYHLKKVDDFLAAHPHQDSKGTAGYSVYVPARKGVPVTRSYCACRLIYDAAYDREKVAAEAEANSKGLQKLLDRAGAKGFRKVVMKPGVYRVSHKFSLKLPDGMIFDLNGATLKLNGFAGSSATMVRLAGVTDSHLVNGTLEGDYFEHDYAAKESGGSEWVCGFGIAAASKYSSVEDVKVVNITGYGAYACWGEEGVPADANNPYKSMVRHGYDVWCGAKKNVVCGALNPLTGKLDAKDTNQWHSAYVDISDLVPYDYLQLGSFGGYMDNKLKGWNYVICYYDALTNFISGEVAHQYRHTLVPAKAKFARLSIGASSVEEVKASYTYLEQRKWPRNCAVRQCVFDRVRAVGIVPSHSTRFQVVGNEFLRSGESLAKCAFDAEDGWECTHDLIVENNWFHDNPDGDLVACAGFNHRYVGNRGSIYLYPRVNSSYVAHNKCPTLTVGVAHRLKTGYTRVEDNEVPGCLWVGGLCKGYVDWDVAISDQTYKGDGSANRPVVLGGPCGRFRNCVFEDIDTSVVSAESCVFRNCKTRKPQNDQNGRWTDCRMENSGFSAYAGSMFFIRCFFQNSYVNSIWSKFRFEDCDLSSAKLSKDTLKMSTFNNCKGVKSTK